MKGWRDIIREERRREKRRVLYPIAFIILLIVAVGLFLIVQPSQVSYNTCVELFSSYDAAVNGMQFQNNTFGEGTLFFNNDDAIKVSMLVLDGAVSQCELSENKDMYFTPDKKYDCNPGKYYYKTGHERGLYFIVTKAVPKDGAPFSKVKYFKDKNMYNAYMTDLQNSLVQIDCEEL
ncbi:MAG: hypothetical protein HZB66_03230 [Candidatus Aenigmarchaeota archaeon]|nr:hypothetical protein [Candidatus Aenigmarchaeota archaeon]